LAFGRLKIDYGLQPIENYRFAVKLLMLGIVKTSFRLLSLNRNFEK
jgi:hypothetical protein